MLSLRCRINANVAELLVIIGYSELGPTLGARPFALHRSPACLHPGLSLASSPVWSFSRLPRCCGSHWRASRWTAASISPPAHRVSARRLSSPATGILQQLKPSSYRFARARRRLLDRDAIRTDVTLAVDREPWTQGLTERVLRH